MILKRVALIDPEAIGMGLTVFVSVETGDHSTAWLARFAQTVTAMPEVMEFHRMAGDFRVKSVRMNVCKHDPVRRLIQGKRPAFFRGRDS